MMSTTEPAPASAPPVEPKKRRIHWNLVGTYVSCVAALISCFAAVYANRQDAQRNVDNDYYYFQRLLSDLNRIEQNALSSSGCVGDDCLGSLAFGETYFNQYELLAMQAAAIAPRIQSRIDNSETFQLAKALYISGRLDAAKKYADVSATSSDPSLRFKANLLLAQIAFLSSDLQNGGILINKALEGLTKNRGDLSDPEISIKKIQAHLICASMHIAIGRPDDARGCMKAAYEILVRLPATTRKEQLDDTLQELIVVYFDTKAEKKDKTYDDLEAEIKNLIDESERASAADLAPPSASVNRETTGDLATSSP